MFSICKVHGLNLEVLHILLKQRGQHSSSASRSDQTHYRQPHGYISRQRAATIYVTNTLPNCTPPNLSSSDTKTMKLWQIVWFSFWTKLRCESNDSVVREMERWRVFCERGSYATQAWRSTPKVDPHATQAWRSTPKVEGVEHVARL